MGTQATLHQFYSQTEFTTTEFTKTVVFTLESPTKRKQHRLEQAIENAGEVTRIASNRMHSVPKHRWGTAKPKDSTWYGWAKEIEHGLSNQTAHENIQRVREAYRSWQASNYAGKQPKFDKNDRCTFYYGQPRYTQYGNRWYLSLPLAAGRGERELLPIRDGDYVRTYLNQISCGELLKGRGELLRKNNRYQFHQVIRHDVSVLASPKTMVGVDVGLRNLAVAGAIMNGDRIGAELWSGREASEYRRRFHERKQAAQRDSQYEKISDAEQRYIENVCHSVSRQVIDWIMDNERPMVVLEDIVGIRDSFIRRKREFAKDDRRALHSWPFRKLQDMIEYKAIESGIPVRYIDPAYTSQRCASCGFESAKNRNGIQFECKSCDYMVNADVNAAFNIAASIEAS